MSDQILASLETARDETADIEIEYGDYPTWRRVVRLLQTISG